MFKGGYAGKILRIDLSNESTKAELFDETIARTYIGGRGLGAYLAYTEMKPNLDPFTSESPIYLLTGPLQGTMTPFAPKFVIINKSPL
jgi:aldehyde:ferredoxin oxidoreductase